MGRPRLTGLEKVVSHLKRNMLSEVWEIVFFFSQYRVNEELL